MTDHSLPDDLAKIARRLEVERPLPTGVELERVRQRAMAADAGRKSSQTTTKVGTTMKPRLAILSMLAAGLLLMGTGTGLGLSGISSSENASVAQYPTTTTPTTGGVGGQQGGGGVGALDDRGGAAGEARQVAATGDGDSLPFTGFAAIPIIVAGLGLLVGGLVVRRRTTPGS
jgi:hypothetical protein